MTAPEGLNERELRVLEAVVQAYIDTAEPAGSHAIARRSRLGVSSATIRSAMSELEEKGYLYHPTPRLAGFRPIVVTGPTSMVSCA